MCRYCQRSIENSIKAMTSKDLKLVEEVIEFDKSIDSLSHEIERDCLEILLIDHPLACDFRFVSSSLKMITDLERIGDYAVDIAEIAGQLDSIDIAVMRFSKLTEMAKIAIRMVNDSVTSFINEDEEEAKSLDKTDDLIDDLFIEVQKDLLTYIKGNNEDADSALKLVMVAKYIERIGDHAVNIGESVEYYLSGNI